MLNFISNLQPKTPEIRYEFTDIELIGFVAYCMEMPEYHVYQLACKEVGMTDRKEIDKSWEKFYFPKIGRNVLISELRQELRKACRLLRRD